MGCGQSTAAAELGPEQPVHGPAKASCELAPEDKSSFELSAQVCADDVLDVDALVEDLPQDYSKHRGAPLPADEQKRMHALKSLCVLDTPPDKRFDEVTSLCSMIFKVPICLVSLVDEDRQWFKSRQGLEGCETSRESSFCAWGLLPKCPKVLVVSETYDDIRFRNNPLVLGPPNIRFYAGTPLILRDGQRMGSLCLIDRVPHHDFDAQSCMMLANFGEMVVRELEKDRLLMQQKQAEKSSLLNAIDCLNQAMIMCNLSDEQWPVIYSNEAWSSQTDIATASGNGEPLPFWELFQLKRQDENGDQTCGCVFSEAIKKQTTFLVTVKSIREPGMQLRLRFSSAQATCVDKTMQTGIPSSLPEAPQTPSPSYYYGAVIEMRRSSSSVRPPVSRGDSGTTASLRDDCVVVNDKVDPFEGVAMGALLGRGAFGRVYRAQLDDSPVAVKVLEHEETAQGREVLEAVLSSEISHSNVVKTYKYCTREMPTATCVDGPKQMLETWIIMEFCSGGTLSDAVERGWFRHPHSLFEPNFQRLLTTAKEIASAMVYLHSRNILHGDLTGGNILFVESDRLEQPLSAKIADFGFSRVLEGQDVKTVSYGTITHTPPELLVDGVLSKACDVYAFGMVLWELYMGQRPFTGLNQAQVIHHVMSGRALSISSSCPDSLRKLIQQCTNAKHEQRPTFAAILDELDEIMDDLGA